MKDFDALMKANAQYTSPQSQAEFLDAMTQIIMAQQMTEASADAKSIKPKAATSLSLAVEEPEVLLLSLSGIERSIQDADSSLPPLFSVLIDETQSCAVTKELIVYLRSVVRGKASSMFAGICQVRDGKAKTIMAALRDVLEKRAISMDQLVGFGCDGAATNLGE